MVNLETIIQQLKLKVITTPKDFSRIFPSSGYNSDLLSCVMAGAAHDCIWVTLQCHKNIVAVAVLIEASAIIITEGAMPDQETINKANEENIILLSTQESSFPIIGKLWQLGIGLNQ